LTSDSGPGWPADKLVTAFAQLQISPQGRGEKLSLQQFVAPTENFVRSGVSAERRQLK